MIRLRRLRSMCPAAETLLGDVSYEGEPSEFGMTFPSEQSIWVIGGDLRERTGQGILSYCDGALVGLAVAYSILLRAYIAWDLPLWLDESWTAVLSSAPDFPTFSSICGSISTRHSIVLMWLWPFESSLGLRIPSFLFCLPRPRSQFLWRPAVRRETACSGRALLLLWQPGIGLFIDARYYALLMLLSTAQTIAFIKLLDEPTLKRACWWTGFRPWP